MIELSIRFTAASDDSPLRAAFFRPDTGASTEPAPFTPPLDDTELKEIRWYLETFSVWPTGPDYARAARIESQLEEWGRALRDAVRTDLNAADVWREFLKADGDKQITIDATDPRVLRLPWELLADEAGHLFAQGVSIRRRLQKTTTSKIKPLALPVRILVVIARPDDASFIDPRADAQALLDATDSLGDQVVVEFLTPPTLKALTDRLRDKNAPPVHVVHFDGHGVYDQEHGLGYLLFENANYKKDLVDANRLGTLLSRSGVPLMALSACQSGMQEEAANPYASVAARLIRAGVGSVLAMNYSVLVAAAHKFTAAFYRGLAAGQTVGQAVDEGRFTLLQDTDRHTLTRPDADGNLVEVTVKLQDWFLPALYQQAADPVIFTPDAQPPISNHQSPISNHQSPIPLPADLPPAPPHGFHGRSREMLALERAFAAAPLHVLHGFGGLGKTALAVEAGRWFSRTGRFPGGAAFVSFEGGGSLDQLCSWAGQTLSGDKDWAIHGEGTLPDRLAALLRERPALLILDNFESVLGKAPLMPPEELQELLNFVGQVSNLSGQFGNLPYKGSCVLITTRDTSFNDARFAPSRTCRHIPLSGLAAPDALALAAAILDDYGIDRPGRRELVDLMTYLGGHPLSLNLVLPRLREYSPAELIARFEELLPGFTRGQAAERNESLAVSLEFSLRRLGDETRAALPDLAVFQGGCLEQNLLTITEMDGDLWRVARGELEQAALVTIEAIPGVNPPFLRFHPTLLPYLSTQLADERRTELETKYWQFYYTLANFLYETDTQNPHQARAIAVREMPNLRRGLALALAAGALDEVAVFADRIARFLDVFGRWRERDEMMAQVGKRLSVSGNRSGKLTKTEFLLMSQQGDTLWQQGRAAQAEAVFRELLARLAAGAAYGDEDVAYDTAMTQWRIGRCLEAQGQPAQAIALHQQALAGFAALSEGNKSAKEMLGKVYTDLGTCMRQAGEFDEAQEAYETALRIKREVEDHRAVGVTLGQLGTLAQRRGDLAEAQRRYRAALDTFRALGEPQSEAVAWHQLGMVAQEARQWAEAERCYREAMQIDEARGNLPGVAQTCNQLAIVAEGDGRAADAERWYLRAIEVGEQLGDQQGLAKRLSNLADLYLSQNRLAEAETTARRALAIKETLDLSAEPWKTYGILADIATAQNRPQAATQWRRKAQETYAAYPGSLHEIREWLPIIEAIVAVCQGNTEIKAQVNEILGQYEQGWSTTVAAIRQILVGKRDIELLREGLAAKGFVIVRTILAQLAGAAPANTATKTSAVGEAASHETAEVSATLPPQEERITLEQLLALVAQAIRPGAPAGLSAQLHELTQTLAHSPEAPPEIRALGQALNAILSGDRDPDLTALPPELAAAIQQIL